jgi:hypothetical protein
MPYECRGVASLFDQVVQKTGLGEVIGPGTVERALETVGSTAEVATLDDYRRALDNIKGRMAAYMDPADVNRHVRAIEYVLRVQEEPTAPD